MMIKNVLATALMALAWPVLAQTTPVGLWRSVDDASGEAKAEIRIAADSAGVLSGRIEKAITRTAEPLCTQCSDERKGKPKLGMEIIRGVRQAEGKPEWEGGKILDPENGKEYTVRLVPLEGGRQLQVRGYIGPFYRTQVWQRIE